jgi:CRP/FNR family transcriptional regulator
MIPDHFPVQNKCAVCGFREHHFFCELADDSRDAFEQLKITNTYPAGSMLFVEGQPANGVYLLCQGRVKLFTCSREGKVVILHIALPGELLGLSAVVADEDYEVSAEVIEPCQTNYVRRSDFMQLMRRYPDIGMKAVLHLSRQYQDAYHQIRSFGLSNSVAEKLAKLMLEWCDSDVSVDSVDVPVRVRMHFTHEEMAEMIGTSRETVTRLLKQFKQLDLITIKGSDLYVHDPRRLEGIIGRPRGSPFRP